MDTLIEAGEAIQLLPEFDVGPTWYGDAWWVIPQGPGEIERGYTLAPDEAQLELTEMFLVLARSADVVAEIQQERREEARRAQGDDPWPYHPPAQRRRWRKR
ncbi:hypothetical protein [Pseudonocardia acidicola]|uniref:Uncharacterized protein n=1 Tax=Pseudonocardia acidicola TaxID=2724939 RepID=A0ABX1S4T0_9PSEU|nr:hypothetical protein [Pseudonocardia acidicola]NMH96606.1 hypothetical protein [Pseudonocardia acidicola]